MPTQDLVGSVHRVAQRGDAVLRACTSMLVLCIILGGCSPYAFQAPVKAFNSGADDLSAALADSSGAVTTDLVARQNAEWRDTRPGLSVAGACDVHGHGSCGLVVTGPHRPPDPATMAAAQQRLDQPLPSPASGGDAAPTSAPVCTLPPGAEELPATVTAPRRDAKAQAEVARALRAYAIALAAVTNAGDRTAYDAASADLATSVGGLAGAIGTAAGGAGAAVGPAAKALTGAVTLVAGTVLDQRRYSALRSAVDAACIPVRTLADVAGVLLLADWNDRMLDRRDTARQLASGLGPKLSPKAYAERLQEAQAAVSALATLRDADPVSAATSMRTAHDALVEAMRDDGRAQIFAALSTAAKFAEQASAVRDALKTSK